MKKPTPFHPPWDADPVTEFAPIHRFLIARIGDESARAHSALEALDGQKWTAIYAEEVWLDRASAPLPLRLFVTQQSPQRVIDDLATKARILTLHTAEEGQHPDFCGHDRHELPCPTLRALAQPYREHPDYRPEWAPRD